MRDIQLYAHMTAYNLLGRAVKIYFRAPIVQGAGGTSFYDSQGEPVIEIEPDRSPERVLYVLLHELAHHKLKHTSGRVGSQAPGSIKINWEQAKVQPTEREAHNLAVEWLAYANLHKRDSNDYLLSRLQALAIAPIVDKIMRGER